jgi:pyridoxamine 5'-phosphate oxidase
VPDTHYDPQSLLTPSAVTDPMEVFDSWYAVVERTADHHPNAMVLATATKDGEPSARMVLLKGVVDGGFRFFTNYESRKGLELGQNPHGALLFYWPWLARQVRVEGPVRRLSDADSDEYFASRPRESQLSAAVSPQSRPMARKDLLAERAALELMLNGEPVGRPEFWGGYELVPASIELWVGDPNRLHHRHRYQRNGSSWDYDELAP